MEQSFWSDLEQFGNAYGVLFIILMLLFSGGIGFFFWAGWWKTNREGGVSPITGGELATGDLLTFDSVQKVRRFLLDQPQPENAPFETTQAVVCRDSGCLFPRGRDAFGVIRVRASYLSKYHPGNWVPWDELTSTEKERLLRYHPSLHGYDKKMLWADPFKAALIGWQSVPGTELRVLIVRIGLKS